MVEKRCQFVVEESKVDAEFEQIASKTWTGTQTCKAKKNYVKSLGVARSKHLGESLLDVGTNLGNLKVFKTFQMRKIQFMELQSAYQIFTHYRFDESDLLLSKKLTKATKVSETKTEQKGEDDDCPPIPNGYKYMPPPQGTGKQPQLKPPKKK